MMKPACKEVRRKAQNVIIGCLHYLGRGGKAGAFESSTQYNKYRACVQPAKNALMLAKHGNCQMAANALKKARRG